MSKILIRLIEIINLVLGEEKKIIVKIIRDLIIVTILYLGAVWLDVLEEFSNIKPLLFDGPTALDIIVLIIEVFLILRIIIYIVYIIKRELILLLKKRESEETSM